MILKDLYERSLEKWEMILSNTEYLLDNLSKIKEEDLVKRLRYIQYKIQDTFIREDVSIKCSFCYSVDGDCSTCPINHYICGSNIKTHKTLYSYISEWGYIPPLEFKPKLFLRGIKWMIGALRQEIARIDL